MARNAAAGTGRGTNTFGGFRNRTIVLTFKVAGIGHDDRHLLELFQS